MTVPDEGIDNTVVGACVAQSHAGFEEIHFPGCAATIWKSTPSHKIQNWVRLNPDDPLSARLILAADTVRDAIHKTALICGTPACPECSMLADDIVALPMILAQVMDASSLRLRLDVANGDAFCEFRIGAVTARLVCTYRDPGTQNGISTDGATSSRVFAVPACAPIILRGIKRLDGANSGLLHRETPIEGSGETRLLLVLDPVTVDAEDHQPEHITTIH